MVELDDKFTELQTFENLCAHLQYKMTSVEEPIHATPSLTVDPEQQTILQTHELSRRPVANAPQPSQGIMEPNGTIAQAKAENEAAKQAAP